MGHDTCQLYNNVGLSRISGLDYWTGILEWPKLLQLFLDMTAFWKVVTQSLH